jgi:hypothetical protein
MAWIARPFATRLFEGGPIPQGHTKSDIEPFSSRSDEVKLVHSHLLRRFSSDISIQSIAYYFARLATLTAS